MQIILKVCTEHSSNTAVFCAKFQNNLTTEVDIVDKRDFERFEFKISFSYGNNPQGPISVDLIAHFWSIASIHQVIIGIQ